MKIALPYDRGRINPHFGHTQYVEVYDIEGGKINGRMVLPTKGSGHTYMTNLMRKLNVSIVIAGGMGKAAILALREYGIEVFMGLQGSTEHAVDSYLEGEINGFSTKNVDLDQLEDHCECHE